MNLMSSFGDRAVKFAMGNPTVSMLTYESLVKLTSVDAPGVLKMVSICYNSLLNDASKQKLADFVRTDPYLSTYDDKYIILTGLMKNESTDPILFLKENEALVTPFLTMLHVDTSNLSIESLKLQLNAHIDDIINLIKVHENTVSNILGKVGTHGGKRKKSRSKRRSRKSRQRSMKFKSNLH